MPSISFEAFRATLDDAAPPAGLSPALAALWHDAQGRMGRRASPGPVRGDADGAWVHAYLHRVEGDLANAGYWYRRAGRPASEQPLPDEWTAIVKALLGE